METLEKTETLTSDQIAIRFLHQKPLLLEEFFKQRELRRQLQQEVA